MAEAEAGTTQPVFVQVVSHEQLLHVFVCCGKYGEEYFMVYGDCIRVTLAAVT